MRSRRLELGYRRSPTLHPRREEAVPGRYREAHGSPALVHLARGERSHRSTVKHWSRYRGRSKSRRMFCSATNFTSRSRYPRGSPFTLPISGNGWPSVCRTRRPRGIRLLLRIRPARFRWCSRSSLELTAGPNMGPMSVRVTGSAGVKDFLKTILSCSMNGG